MTEYVIFGLVIFTVWNIFDTEKIKVRLKITDGRLKQLEESNALIMEAIIDD